MEPPNGPASGLTSGSSSSSPDASSSYSESDKTMLLLLVVRGMIKLRRVSYPRLKGGVAAIGNYLNLQMSPDVIASDRGDGMVRCRKVYVLYMYCVYEWVECKWTK